MVWLESVKNIKIPPFKISLYTVIIAQKAKINQQVVEFK